VLAGLMYNDDVDAVAEPIEFILTKPDDILREFAVVLSPNIKSLVIRLDITYIYMNSKKYIHMI
jgi:hypothetical protein